MYKMICLDLDGTLLDTNKKVSETNKKAIIKALDEGLQVVLVSGRPNCFTKYLTTTIDSRMGDISFNGAHIQVGNYIEEYPIDFNIVKQLAELVNKYDLTAFFKGKHMGIISKEDPHIHNYYTFKGIIPDEDYMGYIDNVDPVEYFKNHQLDVVKVLYWDKKVDILMGPHKAEVEKLPNVQVYNYSGRYMECASDKITKGSAIQRMAKQLNIDMKDVVCIGDNDNDLPMLKIAGLSIAMDNAPDHIKQQVDLVTRNNDEDGVAYAIYNYILNKGE